MAFGSVVLSFLWTLENLFVGGYESSNFWSLLERSVSLALLAYVGSTGDGQWQEVLLKNMAPRIKQIRLKYWLICTFDVLLVSCCLRWKVDAPVSSSTFDVIFIRLNHFIKLASELPKVPNKVADFEIKEEKNNLKFSAYLFNGSWQIA